MSLGWRQKRNPLAHTEQQLRRKAKGIAAKGRKFIAFVAFISFKARNYARGSSGKIHVSREKEYLLSGRLCGVYGDGDTVYGAVGHPD